MLVNASAASRDRSRSGIVRAGLNRCTHEGPTSAARSSVTALAGARTGLSRESASSSAPELCIAR